MTLDAFIRHAREYGGDEVLDSAIGILSDADLDLLRIELDRIEAERKSGRYTVGTRRRRSQEETRRFVLALAEEHKHLVEVAVVHRIADQVGLTDAYVERVMKEARKAEIDPREPPVQADLSATNPVSATAYPKGGRMTATQRRSGVVHAMRADGTETTRCGRMVRRAGWDRTPRGLGEIDCSRCLIAMANMIIAARARS